MKLNRREALYIGLGGVAFAALPMSAHAAESVEELIAAFAGGATPGSGGITLTAPEIAENGNTVPMTILVDSPMTEKSHVTDVLVVAEGNPRGGVLTFHFNPMSGVAEASTRIRLAKSQKIVAVAKMNDGSFYIGSKDVKVTIGGCG